MDQLAWGWTCCRWVGGGLRETAGEFGRPVGGNGGWDDTSELLALVETGRSGSASLGVDMLQVCRDGGREDRGVRRASLGGLWRVENENRPAGSGRGQEGGIGLGIDMLHVIRELRDGRQGAGASRRSRRASLGACGRE